MKKTIEAILIYLLVKIRSSRYQDKFFENNLTRSIEEYFGTIKDDKLASNKIYEATFNIRYANDVSEDIKPYDLLRKFRASASKGNPLFMQDPFYRHLRKVKDREVTKLKYLLKRNQH